ncbi:MFS transporter [Tardiphaga sp. vice154]|uniref:MFS transporter n=1 Tax=Tardiphaga sp. vice154 TaxID=2592814 RepID=UPI0011620C84|nr:MFS transporter [Tardiphaga sp. vice154]MBC7580311.1 MFS transporter [Tardiphaga sp.]QDM22589.1 MFS transporter [Tardiphaga sp. vice154]
MRDSISSDEQSPRYFGWRIVAALFLVELSIFGFGLYGHGIYVTELRRLNDWPTGLIASGTTLSLVLGSLLSMFVSDLLRWLGPRSLVLAGVAALATGLALLGSATSVLQLYIGFSVLALAWVGLGAVTAAAIVGAWFDRKRGLAISLTYSGATCSGIVLAPGLVLLVGSIGFQQALWLAAAATLIVLIPVVATIVRFPRAAERLVASTNPTSATLSRWSLLQDAAFWSLTAPFALALFVQVAFIVHQIAILIPSIGFQRAGVAVSLTTAMSLAGRIGLGLFADRTDPRRVAVLSILSQSAALAVIGQSSDDSALLVACAVFGFSIGNLITLPALIVQREFAPGAFSVVLGLSMGVAGVINACGPAAMGLLRDLSGGYTTPIFIGVVIQVASALGLLLKPAIVRRMA